MNTVKRILLILFILASVVVVLLPFVWMISVSFRPNNQVLRTPPTIFGGIFTLDIYPRFLERWDFFRIFFNTAYTSIAAAVASTITSALAGFGFAKYRFKGRNALFLATIATVMIPIFVILVPLYLLMQQLGWYNNYRALIMPFLASPFGVFLMRQFIYSVPDELIYAARIDGCSEYGIFSRIVLPIIKPAIGSLIILVFIQRWDDLLWPSVITLSEKMRVLSVKLSQISRENAASANWNLTMVGTVLSTTPIVIMFLFMQRFFIRSITMSGIKD